MSHTTATSTSTNGAESSATASTPDERLAYQGILQRLFVRPEIGAIIGAVGIFLFYWAVADSFGTANNAKTILDGVATLGIMAVAVSMLMVGGEFDLSSGATTGAMGMLLILFVKDIGDLGGFGLNLWLALPITFAVAMGIGWLNGWMVERTALPSFIITLGTYFNLRGIKNGFTKWKVGKVEMGPLEDGEGYAQLKPIFAGVWERTDHQLASRDWIYTICVLGGLALLMLAFYEFQFRPGARKAAGMTRFVVGTAAAVGGVIVLHITDNIAGNALGAAAIAAGVIVGLLGFCSWRFESADREVGSLTLAAEHIRLLAIGAGTIGAGCIAALAIDSRNDRTVFFPFTVQGIRAILFGSAVIVGFVVLGVLSGKLRRVNPITRLFGTLVPGVAVVLLAFFVQLESRSVKFRSEAFSVMLAIGLIVIVWGLCNLRFAERSGADHAADRRGRLLMIVSAALLTVGFAVKLLFTVQREIDADIAKAGFSMRIVWFVAFTVAMVWVLGRTRFGSWTFAVGGNKEAARQVGVPAARTKTALFMIVAGAAWLVGILIAFRVNAVQANAGDGQEFEYIVAAVVGGTLLTGGYGTALGGAIGAIIMEMGNNGIYTAQWNTDWSYLFIGVMLWLAVLANRTIRNRAAGVRR